MRTKALIGRTILISPEAARRAMATLALTVLLALAASEAHAGIAFVQSLGTNAMPACASDAARASRTVSASVAMARRAASGEIRIVRPMRALVLISYALLGPRSEPER